MGVSNIHDSKIVIRFYFFPLLFSSKVDATGFEIAMSLLLSYLCV